MRGRERTYLPLPIHYSPPPTTLLLFKNKTSIHDGWNSLQGKGRVPVYMMEELLYPWGKKFECAAHCKLLGCSR